MLGQAIAGKEKRDEHLVPDDLHFAALCERAAHL
jgi:hypothetical protein